MTIALDVRAKASEETIQHFRNLPFSWGTADCAHVVAHCYEKMTRKNLLDGIRNYKTARGARLAMVAAGAKNFVRYLDERFERIAPAMIIPGDIIAFDSDERGMRHALGVSVGHNLIFGYAAGVAAIAPLTVVTHAWRAA